MAVVFFLVVEVVLRLTDDSVRELVDTTETTAAVEDSALGHLYRPHITMHHRTHEFDVEYCTNAYGMRDSCAEGVTARSTRILVVGDSFTFGASNDYRDIWPVITERRLRAAGHDVDVINAGVEGYDTRSEALYLRRLYDVHAPDIVVVGFLANDLFANRPLESQTESSAKRHRRKRTMSQLATLALAKRIVLSSDAAYARVYLMTARRQFFSTPISAHAASQLQLTGDILDTIHRDCEQHAARLFVLSIPQQFQVIANAKGGRRSDIDVHYIDEVLSQRARAAGYEWAATLPTLADHYRTHGVPLYYRIDGHLTPLGNQLVGRHAADALAGFLDEW